jgi:hypothetical protein
MVGKSPLEGQRRSTSYRSGGHALVHERSPGSRREIPILVPWLPHPSKPHSVVVVVDTHTREKKDANKCDSRRCY